MQLSKKFFSKIQHFIQINGKIEKGKSNVDSPERRLKADDSKNNSDVIVIDDDDDDIALKLSDKLVN